MRNTLIALADVCEADADIYPGIVGKIIRGAIADAEATEMSQGGRFAPPPQDDTGEANRLRAALLKAETEVSESRLKIGAADDTIQKMRDELGRKSAHIGTLCDQIDAIRKVMPDRFFLDPPDGGDVRTHEGVMRMAAALVVAESSNEALTAEINMLYAQNHALKTGPVPATDETLITLEQAIAEGGQHLPADDENEDMGGSLDPLADEASAIKIIDEVIASHSSSRSSFPPYLPRQSLTLAEGVEIEMPYASHKVASRMIQGGATLPDVIALGVASTENSAQAAVSKAKRFIEKQTDDQWTVMRLNGAYHIVPTQKSRMPTGGLSPSVQSAGDPGSSPEKEAAVEGAPVSAGIVTPEAAPCVTSSGAGEGSRTPADPAPETDGGAIISVTVKTGMVTGPSGFFVHEGGTRLSKALSTLCRGEMFGLSHIALVAGWPNAEVARGVLLDQKAALKKIGVDIFMDATNVRLRPVSA